MKSYFPYHSLTTEVRRVARKIKYINDQAAEAACNPAVAQNCAQDFLSKYWDTLVYVEATIYQEDEENEGVTRRLAQGSGDAPPPPDEGATTSTNSLKCTVNCSTWQISHHMGERESQQAWDGHTGMAALSGMDHHLSTHSRMQHQTPC